MKIKVMTFNLRCKNGGDGINSFDNRKEKILTAINNELPDIIGFQEATDSQRAFLKENLSDKYLLLGCGREKNYFGESVCIAYRHGLFEIVSFETFWLSDTPDVPGSFYSDSDQSTCPRFTVHAELISKELDSPLHFFNTHLDHLGANARLKGIRQIAKKISSTQGAYILTGDFNARPDSDVISELERNEKLGCVEVTKSITHTFHGFGRFERDHKIDYIFTNGKPITAYAVEDTPNDGIYISDHYPVCAELEI